MDKKPIYVKVYEAVYFDRKLHTHFPNKMWRLEDLDISIEPGVGVEIASKADRIYVPMPNVAFVRLEPKAEKKKAASKAKAKSSKAE
jgi:hypothetical protein